LFVTAYCKKKTVLFQQAKGSWSETNGQGTCKIQKLEQQLESKRRRANRYKKRHQREIKKSAAKASLTPRSKTRRLLRYMNVSNDVSKTVLFHSVVVQNLQEKYVGLKSRCARKNFQNFF